MDEVALIRDTISRYAPVLIAPLSIQIRRAGVQGGSEFVPRALAFILNLDRRDQQLDADDVMSASDHRREPFIVALQSEQPRSFQINIESTYLCCSDFAAGAQ